MLRKIILITIFVTSLFSQSESKFPDNWKSFKSIRTPLTLIGPLPACDADISALPLIYKEMIQTYCSIKDDGPGAIEILINQSAQEPFKNRDGNFPDGATMILHLKELKILFITSYKNNKPLYSIYTEDGEDASREIETGLNPIDCRTCHTGYAAFCLNGQCGLQQ